MLLRTVVRDCLYLNWALPRQALPEPPAPLRYELFGAGSEHRVMISALLFRHRDLRWSAFPPIRLSHPQMNLRSYVVDGEGVPSVWFHAVFMPRWAGLVARATTRMPCRSARLRYPGAVDPTSADGDWEWTVGRGGRELAVSARLGVSASNEEPLLGDWARTTDRLRRRSRGYVASSDGLRRVEATHESVDVCPVAASVQDASLLAGVLTGVSPWPALHSSWLCPRVPLSFEVARPKEAPVGRHVPAPG